MNGRRPPTLNRNDPGSHNVVTCQRHRFLEESTGNILPRFFLNFFAPQFDQCVFPHIGNFFDDTFCLLLGKKSDKDFCTIITR